MNEYFSKMNEEYVQKHFPDGSVFQGAISTVKRGSFVGLFFFGILLVGSLCGLLWGIHQTQQFVSNGEDDMLTVGIVICGFFGIIAFISLIMMIFLIKGLRKNQNDYIADSAKHSELPVSEIEAFEKQAVASDCYILKLTKGLDRVLSNATNKDGLLTKDYIYLADPRQTVMRVDSLKACSFAYYSYYINVGNRRKKILCLAVYLIASNGVSVLSDTSEEAGHALMSLLQQRNNNIDTNEGAVIPENEIDNYKANILAKQ